MPADAARALALPQDADPAAARQCRDFRLRFSWRLKSEYAFFLLAEQAGLYRANGLDMTFLEGSGASCTIADAIDDPSCLAVVPAGFALTAIESGAAARIVALYQRSANVVLLSRRGRPVVQPTDFAGKTVAHVEGEVGTSFLEHLCRLNGVDFAAINFVLTTSKDRIALFRRGAVDVISVYRTNDLRALQREFGDDLCVFDPGLHGLTVPGMCVVAGETAMLSNGQAIGNFLTATAGAIIEMAEDAHGAIAAYKARVEGMDTGLLHEQFEEILRSLDVGTGPLPGHVDHETMVRAVTFLSESGTLNGTLRPDRFYTNAFFAVR